MKTLTSPSKFLVMLVNIWLCSMLTGCFAATVPVPQTLNGMRAAVNGAPNTFVYAKSGADYFVLGWPAGSKYAFMLVDQAGQALKDLSQICATRCSWASAAEFTAWLEMEGWQIVSSKALPAAVSSEVLQLAYLISLGSRAMPTLLLVPMTVNPVDFMNPVRKS